MGLSYLKQDFHSKQLNLRQLINGLLLGLVLVGIAAIAIIPMLIHGYPITHSTQFNLSWAFQYQRQFASGQLYPRWLEFSNFGFGNATFVFYPPMLMIATLPFSLLGMDVPSSLIGSMVLAAFTLAWGIYLYAKLYFPSWLALVIAGLAVASPYFLIDIYQRGAIAEVWAIAFIPWVLRATYKLIDQIINQVNQAPVTFSQPNHAISLAIAWGMMGLSHLPTLLISFLVWLLIPLWLLKDLLKHQDQQDQTEGASRTRQRFIVNIGNYLVAVGRCYLSAILGFVGISFFLLPIICDQQLVQIASINFSPEYLPQNRLLLDGLHSLHPHFASHWFETSSGMIPYFGLIVTVLLIGAIAWLINRNDSMGLWLSISAIALLMTTDLGAWLYSFVPILQKIQFSWRWYGLTVTTIPMILGGLGWQIWNQTFGDVASPHHPKLVPCIMVQILLRKSTQIFITVLIIGLTLTSYIFTDKIVFQHTGFDPALVTKFTTLASQKEFPKEPNVEGQGTSILWWHWRFADGLAIVDVPEYRAKEVTMPMPPDRTYPLASYAEPDTAESIQIQSWQFGRRQILVENQSLGNEGDPNQSNKYLTLRMFYYPAWQVWIDDKSALLDANSQGQVQVAIPQGRHLLRLQYVGTQAEQWGSKISWAMAMVLIYIVLRANFLDPVKS